MNKLRSISAVLLSILLMLSAPAAAFAEPDETDLPAASETVEISSAEDFLLFASACTLDSYSAGKCFRLTADIDLAGTSFSPVQNFYGEFDGNGHMISGLCASGDGSLQGLFRRIGEGAVVRDINICGSVIPGGSQCSVGGIAGQNAGTVSGCTFTGTVSGLEQVGGLVGTNLPSGRIENSSFSGAVKGEKSSGGIAGSNSGVIASCENTGDVCTVPVDSSSVSLTGFDLSSFDLSQLTSDDFVNVSDIGGIAGYNNGTVSLCSCSGTVGYPYQGFNVGGIAGKTAGFVSECICSGEVRGQQDVGGIVGQLVPCVSVELTEDLVNDMKTQMDSLNYSVSSVSNSLNSMLGNTSSYASDMVVKADRLNTQLGKLIDYTQDPQGEITDAVDFNEIIDGLNSVYMTSTEMVQVMGSDVQGIASSINSVNTNVHALAGILTSAADKAAEQRVYTEDISLRDAYSRDLSAVSACRSSASVNADTNAGGIIGLSAFELSFDVADALNLSDYVFTDARATFFAAVRDCDNSGMVTVRESFSGGIAGRVTLGAIVGCASASTVSAENGDYIGGIAGRSDGAISACNSRVSLSGGSYLGGIAGCGCDIGSCLSFTVIESGSEYLGAVAGSASGSFEGNRYIERGLGAIDGASYAGKAEGVDISSLTSEDDPDGLFGSVKLEFILPDGTAAERTIPLGGSLKELPAVPDSPDGLRWEWDPFQNRDMITDLRIEGHYLPAITVLSTGEEPPFALAEGVFSHDDTLLWTPAEFPDGTELDRERLLLCGSLSVGERNDEMTFRIRADGGELYVMNDGTAVPEEFIQDGSYIVFTASSGSEIVILAENKIPAAVWYAAGAVPVIAAAVLIICKRGKKKKQA